MSFSHVHLHALLGGITFGTDAALPGPFARVRFHVLLQAAVPSESHSAEVTAKRLNTGVFHLMFRERIPPSELFTALLALVRRLTGVNHEVVRQAPPPGEFLETNFALERFLFRVDNEVLPQVARTKEPLVAILTLKVSLVPVSYHVIFKLVLPHKSSLA